MCLGIPGRVLRLSAGEPRTGEVEFGGIVKEVCLAYTPEAAAGDWVIVHAGFAISRLDEEAALRVFAYLDEIGSLDDLADGPPTRPRP
jgi:hydrogenase expression/formation protein HypC